MRIGIIASLSVAICLGWWSATAAERHYGPGVSDTEIKIGEVMPYSGPAAAFGALGRTEQAYFKMLNATGGVNGRRIVFLSLDSAYSPPKALEVARRLVEQDHVFAMFGDLGTPVNVALLRYLTDAKVPNLFIRTGGSQFNDPKHHPWTVPGGPLYATEGWVYGEYILATKPAAKIAVLYQNDDFGKDYLRGLREALGAHADSMIVATASYEVSDPTLDSQMITLHASGADVLVHIETPKFAALAIRKAADLGWKPLAILGFPAATISVMKGAGVAASTGIVTALSIGGDPTDPKRATDPVMIAYREFMRQYDPSANPDDANSFLGYSQATLVAEVLRRCGDDLTREHLIEVVTHLKGVRIPSSLPGTLITYTPTDYDAFKQFQLYRFDGTRFVPFGALVSK